MVYSKRTDNRTEHLAILEVLSVLQELCIRAFERDDMMREEARQARKQFDRIDKILRKEWGLKPEDSIYKRGEDARELTSEEIDASLKTAVSQAKKAEEPPAFLDALKEIK